MQKTDNKSNSIALLSNTWSAFYVAFLCLHSVSPRGGVVAHMLAEGLEINLDWDQNMFSTQQEVVLWFQFEPNLIQPML